MQRRYPSSRIAYSSELGLALSNCPFCGSANVGVYISPEPHGCCLTCGGEGPPAEREHQNVHIAAHRAIDLWNRRATVDAPRPAK